jgi:hypothetical protein
MERGTGDEPGRFVRIRGLQPQRRTSGCIVIACPRVSNAFRTGAEIAWAKAMGLDDIYTISAQARVGR